MRIPLTHPIERPTGALIVLLCGCILAGPAKEAAGGEAAVPQRPDPAALTGLFRRLEAAFTNGDPEAVCRLLSPRLSSEARSDILKRLRREFRTVAYTEFFLDDRAASLQSGPERLGKAVVFQLLVPCRYRYQSRTMGISSNVGSGNRAFRFWVEKVGDEWFLSGNSDIFLEAGLFNPAAQLGKIIFAGFFFLGLTAFWLFAVWHCYRHTRSAWKTFLVFLSTPVGAAVYFFTVSLSAPED